MKKFILLATILLSAFFLTGCSLYPTSNSQNTSTQTSAAQNSVSIQNFSFTPTTLTVNIGSTVTWTNNDSVVHRIKADTFNSSDLAPGTNFSFTFNTAGTFNYSCSIHPSMTGTILVK